MKKILTIAAVLCALNTTTALAHDAQGTNGQSMYLEHALDSLPSDKAETFRDAMQEAHEQNKDLYAQSHQIHDQLHAMLISPNFDQDAFIKKNEELRNVHDQISQNLDQAFAYGVNDLSQPERQKLAAALEHTHTAKKTAAKNAAQ